jgi:hypothetical protein
MPFIQFSSRDLLRGKVVQPAWYLVRIEGVGEKLANDGGSTNYPAEATIIKNADTDSEDFAGVPVDWNFNSKAIGFAVGFLQALGVQVNDKDRFDLNAASGMELEVWIENKLYEGRTLNNVTHKYRAKGAGKQ